jgi:hypothetical protein
LPEPEFVGFQMDPHFVVDVLDLETVYSEEHDFNVL